MSGLLALGVGFSAFGFRFSAFDCGIFAFGLSADLCLTVANLDPNQLRFDMFDTNDDGLLSELEVQQLVEHGIREAGKWWRPWHWDKSCPLPKFFTWNLKMMVSNRNLLFQGLIFRFHVSFHGCKSLW